MIDDVAHSVSQIAIPCETLMGSVDKAGRENITDDVIHSISEIATPCETLMVSSYDESRENDSWGNAFLDYVALFVSEFATPCALRWLLMGSVDEKGR